MKNVQIEGLIQELKKRSINEKVGIWKRIASDLERPTRSRRIINLHAIDRYSKDNETIIVPGKVLGTGVLSKKVTIAAYSFSDSAKDKIKSAGAKSISIIELIEKNPKGKNVRILG